MAKKTIITAAVTGAWPKKENNPNVPLTPAEIAEKDPELVDLIG